MIELSLRPQLASKARLRFDRHSGRHLLIYPEKGLELNATATAVAQRCRGELSVAQIIDALCSEFADAPRERIQHETLSFLQQLQERGLLQGAL